MASWVCSIGNVPLAAALWGGGISFGGVIAFIFADLIAMPLILVYRKFYGWRLTVRIVGLFYVLMVVAGLATEGIFRVAGAVPTNHAIGMRPTHIAWDYTTFLNLVLLVVAGAVWWLARHRDRFGGGSGYASDPVCGMQVRTADAPARTDHDGTSVWFCSDRCGERFEADPGRYRSVGDARGTVDRPVAGARVPVTPGIRAPSPGVAVSGSATVVITAAAIDPVCGMTVDPEDAGVHRVARQRRPLVLWLRLRRVVRRRGPGVGLTARSAQPFFNSCENGTSLSLPGSLGSPSTRSPMMLRWIWSVPP